MPDELTPFTQAEVDRLAALPRDELIIDESTLTVLEGVNLELLNAQCDALEGIIAAGNLSEPIRQLMEGLLNFIADLANAFHADNQ